MIDRPFENIPDLKLIQFASDLDITESHWTRMIEFAKTQDQRSWPLRIEMKKAIKEDWFDDSCVICLSAKVGSCKTDCPLGIMHGVCRMDNNRNFWGDVQSSLDWGEWGQSAEKFLKQIEKVHEEVTKEILRRNLSLRNEEEEVIQ